VTSPWVGVEPLRDADFAALRRRLIFDGCKWDPQVGDASVIARCPLVIDRAEWERVARLAEALARETRAVEAELVKRTDLHRRLGLPHGARRALKQAARVGASTSAARIIRFDFHFTTEGWRISEANADVPGGLNEASMLPALMAPHYRCTRPVGDPAAAYVDAILATSGRDAAIALVHATAFSDDQQMMKYVADRLTAGGARTHLSSPGHLRWLDDGRARLEAAWWRGPIDLVVKFFPSEWLVGLPKITRWPFFYAGARTPVSNPATAILVQSKRLPLVWDALDTPTPTWRELLPETRQPTAVPWRRSRDWVLKPALGRVGEGVAVPGVIEPKEARRIAHEVTWFPHRWIAQRRFDVVPIAIVGVAHYPCLGVYTVDERTVGGYGRLARRPLVDALATDAAVLTTVEERAAR
jgi:glutathionylspermidine synthase